jgi:thiamine biosynthesis lipoprotein
MSRRAFAGPAVSPFRLAHAMTDARLLIPTGLKAADVRASRIDAPIRRISGETMGTGWSLSFAAEDTVATLAAETAVQEACNTVVRQMSGWESASDLSRYNRAEAGWHAIAPEFAHVLKRALEIAALTDGAYDPTLGEDVEAAGFGSGLLAGRARGEHDWRHVQLDTQDFRVFQPGGAALDLSSIAKGYAGDLCGERLRALGIQSFLMEIGGEFLGQGVKPDAQPWWVELELSDMLTAPSEPTKTDVALVNLAVATSGDFVRRRDGASHLFDGRTAQPVRGALSGVAVMDGSAMEADAWATALFALGAEAGLATADARGLAAVFSLRTPDGAVTRLSAKAAGMLG